MTWVCLFLAGIFEVVWSCTMKISNGFSHFW
ncbi:SMR family transporter [Leuconostoc gasicomitatum]|nr:SMR family transporter [Leuconostoc gasicomitatum]